MSSANPPPNPLPFPPRPAVNLRAASPVPKKQVATRASSLAKIDTKDLNHHHTRAEAQVEPNPLPFFPRSAVTLRTLNPVPKTQVATNTSSPAKTDTEDLSYHRAKAEAQAEFHAHSYFEAQKQAEAYARAEELQLEKISFQKSQHAHSKVAPLTTAAVSSGEISAPLNTHGALPISPIEKMRDTEVVGQEIQKERKKSALVSIVMSIVGILILSGTLYLIRLLQSDYSMPAIVTYLPSSTTKDEPNPPLVTQIQRLPSAAPSA